MLDSVEKLNLKNEELMGNYKGTRPLIKSLSKAYEEYCKIQQKADENPSKIKFSVLAAEKKESFDLLLADLVAVAREYEEGSREVRESYKKLIYEEEKRSERKRLEKEADKAVSFYIKANSELSAALAPYEKYIKSEEPEEKEEKAEEEKSESIRVGASSFSQGYSAPQYAYNPYQPNVNIAPVSLDISPIVENAVKSAITKLSAALDAKIESFIAGFDLSALPKTVVSDSQPTGGASDTIVNMASRVSEEESAVLNKLVSILEGLKIAAEALTTLTDSCGELVEKQRVANDATRRVNDMQRALSRELQGVQASQKVISDDQMAVSESQNVVLEHQKTVLERQNAINEGQMAINDTLRAVSDSHKKLEKTLRSAAQKEAKIVSKTVKQPESEPIALELDTESGKDKLDELLVD